MSSGFGGLLRKFWQPQKSTMRLRSKFLVHKPRPRHFVRAQVEEFVKPFYPRRMEQPIPQYELCQGPGLNKVEEDNRYVELLVKDLYENWFQKHRYIFFYHINSMSKEQRMEMKVALKSCGVVVQVRPKVVVEKALTGTFYEPILILFSNRTLMGFSNDVKLSKMLQALKKTRILLIAGLIDDRLLNVNEINEYSKLPDIETARAMLLSTLNSVAGNVVQKLNYHPQTLAQNLEQHVKISKEKS
ncbi:UNVERIFIED_CONTAM: hypothetical protein PYX00_006169 [Menopon gallinae]|uniref:Large ribosomal subunit protein uL10m n=1 Tax=Menopon gallinae TaxID=328185 RepID=A0AAW2HVB4_9NEOP